MTMVTKFIYSLPFATNNGLINVRYFSSTNEKMSKRFYSYMNNINNNSLEFIVNRLSVWLPSLIYKDQFLLELNNLLNQLSKEGTGNNYLYRLEFSLFLHTDDSSKEVIFILHPGRENFKDNISIQEMMGMKILYNMFKYKGFYIFHSDLLDIHLVKDFNGYINQVYNILGKCIKSTNEDLSKNGFIEYKLPCLFNITRINKSNPSDCSEETHTSENVALGYSPKESSGSMIGGFMSTRRFYSTSSNKKEVMSQNRTKPSELYSESGIDYGRFFGMWKCPNCNNTWTSAYTWVSTDIYLNTNDIINVKYKNDKGYKVSEVWFSGENLKDKDFLVEECKNCPVDSNKGKIIRYKKLQSSLGLDNLGQDHHREELCVKCRGGHKCGDRERYYSTVSSSYGRFSSLWSKPLNLLNKFKFNVINETSKKYYSTVQTERSEISNYSENSKNIPVNKLVESLSTNESNIDNSNTIDYIFTSEVFKSNDVFKLIYTNITNIINDNPINYDTQLKIENYLFNQYKDLVFNKDKIYISDVDFSLFNKEFKDYCFSKMDEFNSFLDLLRENLNSNKEYNINNLTQSNEIHNFYIKKVLNELDNKEIISYMFYVLFLVVTYNGMVSNEDYEKDEERTKIGLTAISMDLGKYLSNYYISKLYKKHKNDNSIDILDFKTFKENFLNVDKQYVLVDSEFFLRFSSKLIEIMTTCGVLDIKVNKLFDRSLVTLKLSNDLEKIFKDKNPIAVLPMDLPMIVPPKSYSHTDLGGFLLNNVEYDQYLIRPKLGYKISSVIEEDNIIYCTINGMMKTPFKVNKDLLKYLLKNNHIHKLLINSDYKHEYSNIKRDKRQEKEYQRFLSKRTLEKYILLIADIYSNVPEIYFPIKLDNRGRLYPSVAFFNYQGSELAKALIQFAIPDIIKRNDDSAIEYLKAYGATCYGNGLNRKSYSKRLEWVKENWDNIINFQNDYLISKADDKFLFLAFCFEMRRFNTFMENEYIDEFKTYLPIQLDGTCNGYQHLALLSNETELFDKLNLGKSKKSNDPSDFYSHVLDILNIHLEQVKKEKETIKDSASVEKIDRLLRLGLNRSLLKPIIMNDPYNATDRTLTSYVRDLLVFDHSEEKPLLVASGPEKGNVIYDENGKAKIKIISWYKITKDSKNYVNYEDLEFLVQTIDLVIYVKYKKIKLLKDYFGDIGKIFNDLNLPIIWRLPTGLKVTQKYMKKHSIQVKPFSYLSNRINLTITDKLKMDKSKQISAFMPNLVHSLDAASLTLLYNSLKKSIEVKNNNSYINFYSVHDCYGVTAKYADLLIQMLRSVYIELYSGKGYIEKFDEDVINTIIITYGESLCKYSPENRTIYIKNRKSITLPDLSQFLNVPNKARVYQNLSESIFLIK